jgi:POT family proton-dependent oligopeptide transporter
MNTSTQVISDKESITQTGPFFGHPGGLAILFFTEMWERFSYYGMRAILFLFLLDKVRGGMGLTEGESGAIYALYTSSVYLLSLPGGWLADNVLGQRKAIWIGGIVIMLGHIVLAFPSSETIFFAGLALVAIGTGLLKPNISSIVSELYPAGGARRDAAFYIFYMGINTGSLLGVTVVGYLGQKVGWHYGFGAAAVAMFLGLVVYVLFARKYLGDIGQFPKKSEVAVPGAPLVNNRTTYLLMGLLGAFWLFLQIRGIFDWNSKEGVAFAMGILITSIAVMYFVNLLVAGGITFIERKRVAVLIVLFIGAVLFWSGFEQQGSSLQIFADRHTDLPFGMPSSWFQNFNPFFILLFAPVLSSLWLFLEKRNLDPSPVAKYAIGLFLLAVGYGVMVLGAQIAITGAKASALFLTFTFLFHTLGELCIGPVGMSTFTKLAPKQYLSQLMGIYFITLSLGNLFAGLFAGGFNKENLQQMPDLFMSIVYFSVIVGAIILLISKPVKKLMGGVK